MTENSNPSIASTYLEKNNWDVTVRFSHSRKLHKITSMMLINMIFKNQSIVSDRDMSSMNLTLMRLLNRNWKIMKDSLLDSSSKPYSGRTLSLNL